MPRPITASPIYRVIFVAFFSLYFEIIFSVGNGSKISITPRISQLATVTIIPAVRKNAKRKIPIVMPKKQIIFIMLNNFPYFSVVS